MGSCSISGDGEDSATPSPEGGQGENHLILVRRWLKGQRYPHCQRKSNSLSSEFSGLRADSVRRTASSLSPTTHLASGQESAVGGRRASHTPLASPYRDSGSSARMSQNARPSVPSCLTPICCTTAGTLIVPLEPLARRLEAWLALPSPSCWLTCTIRLGYAIQFAR